MKPTHILVILLGMVGCRSQGLSFNCVSDAQCGGAGVCVDGGCAFPADCPSGYRWDKSAPVGAGQCVPVGDMSVVGDDLGAIDDMAAPAIPDMVAPSDLTITCAQQGQGCTVGAGACARTGTVVCSSPGNASCSVTPGAPDNTGTWHQAPAANGSWDWDCDGAVEYQYPSGDTTKPPRDTDPNAVTDCSTIGVASVCNAPHWFYQYYLSQGPDSCGHKVTDTLCAWVNSVCTSSGSNEVTEGCR